MNNAPKHILKFGGTSLQNEAFIRQSAQIVIDRSRSAHPFVVVSALGDVTETLISLAGGAGKTTENGDKIDTLEQKHLTIFDRLAKPEDPRRQQLKDLFKELRTTSLQQSSTAEEHRVRKDRILSVGERASALIFAAALSGRGLSAEPFEACRFIKTDSAFGQARVQQDATRKLVRQFLGDAESIPVVTGFIGSDDRERITTLGRSGSDYTAGLLADALEADHLEIWTDVDGVLSADPKWVPTARPIEELSFGDISELSAHGARVIHPKTIRPIDKKETSVRVKNSYNPSHPGTLINKDYRSNGGFKTITITGPFVRLQVPDRYAGGFAKKLTSWLEGEPDPEAFSWQRNSAYEPARFLIPEHLYETIEKPAGNWARSRQLSLPTRRNLFKVKKFSNRFSEDEQLTARIWNLLAAKDLHPEHISRNAGERFISLLFERDEARRAARLLNDYLPHRQTTVDLFIAGTGAVGQTLVEQLQTTDNPNFNFRLLGLCNSRHFYWDDSGLDLNEDPGADVTNWKLILGKLTEPHRHNLIFVDATGSEQVARLYPRLFEAGIHVVTPSKLANTFEQSFFDRLQSAARSNHASFRYETTVGAGLPVISTLNHLKESGDNIEEISGVVSGTMTYLFNQLQQGVPFSEAIVQARELGYAEPDPRDDLSGEDVARKFLTLARTLGLSIERDELEVESLIPKNLENADRDTFLARLPEVDGHWKEQIQKAQKKNEILCYTGKLKDGHISIGIESVSRDSPLGQLKGTDNLIQIHSQFYNQTPLIIQGPGAGKEVTAAGVLGDIIKTADSLK